MCVSCLIVCRLPLMAQTSRSIAAPDKFHPMDFSKLPKLNLKPLTKDEKLKVVNDALSKNKLPTAKNLIFGTPINLSFKNPYVEGVASLQLIRVIADGRIDAMMLYPQDGAAIDFLFKPAAPGKQLFDCAVHNYNLDNSPTTFTIIGNDYVSYKPNLTSQLPTSAYTQHLSFLLDFPSVKESAWLRVSADKAWSFYNCEITPIK